MATGGVTGKQLGVQRRGVFRTVLYKERSVYT